MIYNSKALSLLLSLSTALSAVLVLWLVYRENAHALLPTFFATFAAGFVILYFALDRLFFRGMNRLRDHIRRSAKLQEQMEKADLLRETEVFMVEQEKEIDRLRRLEALRKDFIADVSHELKTPIFAAQGFVHTLLDGAVKEKGVRTKFLKKAAKSLDALDRLVQDLLTLSQIETGQIKMHFEYFDLYALTEEVFEQFRDKAHKKYISLRIEGAVRKVVVHGDPARIGQVMTNLLSNAIKHSAEGSEVVVKFREGKKSVVTQVRDTGEGIAAEHVNRVFERFYRVDKSRSREKGGTGLGLAIVKHILDGHQTRARVKSEPGKGSVFSFKLQRPAETITSE